MKIGVACGGTGGHIFPGLATACELRSRGHAVTLWLAGRDVEAASVDGWDGDIISIRAAGFPSGLSLRAVGTVFRLCAAVFASWRNMRRARPDVVLAMGSYASVGPVIAARLCGVAVVLHEANAVPGRAISFLSRFASRIGITFEAAASYFDSDKVCLTGFPLRNMLSSVAHIPNTAFHLLVMGGSQGAHALNEIVPEAIKQLSSQGVSLCVTHLAGVRDADAVEKHYQACGIPAEVHAFTSDMATIYAAADFAIARAGAATCTELAICGVPALLVPHPTAARNHQMLNARAMADIGGMAVQPQEDLTVEWLVGYLKKCVETPEAIATMRSKLGGSTVENGAEQLANCVESTASA